MLARHVPDPSRRSPKPRTVHDACRATRSPGTDTGAGSSGRGSATGLANATVANKSKASFIMLVGGTHWIYEQ